MSHTEVLSQIHALLADVVLPQLEGIQASQAEQSLQAERLQRHLEEFRAEMQMRFAELHAEIAKHRQEIEDAMLILREGDVIDFYEPLGANKKRLIH